MRTWVLIAALLIGTIVVARPGWTQDSSGISDNVLSNPGARSIGLGGAFAAIADDATAAFANPAGLIQILRPEISAELRGTAASGGYSDPFETVSGVSGLGFFSFVYPSQRWAFALYSHQVASLDFTFSSNSPLTREFTVRSYSGAVAYQINDSLSVGAGVSYFDGRRFSGDHIPDISDFDWGFNAGVLWNVAPTWSVAGFYRQGPGFESDMGPDRKSIGDTLVSQTLKASDSPRLTIPDEFGLGVAYQPGRGGWTFGFEWDRVGSANDPLLVGHSVTNGGSELHFGVEYAVLSWKPVTAFRIGFWQEHGGDREFVVDTQVLNRTFNQAHSHVAFGFGLAFKKFQIDLGADISDRAAVGSVSIVVSF